MFVTPKLKVLCVVEPPWKRSDADACSADALYHYMDMIHVNGTFKLTTTCVKILQSDNLFSFSATRAWAFVPSSDKLERS